jgi:2-iminobutanoate/2-iminopropanoate deaminase
MPMHREPASFPAAFNAPIIRAGDWLIVSGQLGIPVDSGTQAGDFLDEVRAAFGKVRALLVREGATPREIVKLTVFLASLDDYADMNDVCAEFFGDHRPARTTIGARLVRGARVEIEAWAYSPMTQR